MVDTARFLEARRVGDPRGTGTRGNGPVTAVAYEGERGGATAGSEEIDRDRAVVGSEGDRKAGPVGVVFGVAVFVPHPYGAGRLDSVLARRVAR
jgi:hypothetical protein